MTELIIREGVRDAQSEYAQRWSQVVAKFATALTGQRIDCSLSDSTIAPAWSSESSIWLSEPTLPDLQTPHGVLVAKGLALHELGHILFTPRNSTEWRRTVNAEGLQEAMNILEDMRLESMLVARHRGSVSPWLSALILHYLLDDASTIPLAFPLIHGRKFLPLAVRQDVRDAYQHQHIVPDLVRIIDAYRKVVLPRDTHLSLDLIREFKQVLDSVKPTGDGTGEGGTGTGTGTPTDGCGVPNPNHPTGRPESYDSDPDHKPLSQKEQEQLTDRMDETTDGGETDESPAKDEDESATNNQPADADDADADGDDADGSGSDGGESDDSSDSTSDSDADGDSDSDSDSDSTDGGCTLGSGSDSGDDSDTDGEPADQPADQPSDKGGKGAGQDDAGQPAPTSLQDALDAIASTLSDAISQVQEQVGLSPDLQSVDNVLAHEASYTEVALTDPKLGHASVSMAEELERLRAEHEPAWERETRTGRLNVGRLVNNEDTDLPFDRWNDGQDDVTAIEAVIILDNSGSMQGANATNAYASMYALKSAMDMLGDARCTVVTFNYRAHLLYGADEVAGATIRDAGASGGTHAHDAIAYATNILAKSEQPIKLFFAITDGDWSDGQRSDALIGKLRDAGVLTAIAQVGGGSTSDHGCEVYSEVNNTSDLLVLGRKLVNIAVDRNLAR